MPPLHISPVVRFAAENPPPSDKETQAEMPESCCEQRKKGIPVSCCPPLPPDQLELDTLSAQPSITPASGKILGNPVFRVIQGVMTWFKAFFGGLWQDLKLVFTGKE